MNIPKDELIAVLSQFNPWWKGEKIPDLPGWHRAAFEELFTWIIKPPTNRAILLSGARQVGKTTLLLQIISKLLENGVSAANILYATFDHPIIKLAEINSVIEAWRSREPKAQGPEYLFLDEAQFIRDWGTWVKHQVDFNKDRRIVFTGSAMPLLNKHQESGVGRWHSIQLSTLSFYEYLQLKQSTYKTFLNVIPNLLSKNAYKYPYGLLSELPDENFRSQLSHSIVPIDNKLPEIKSLLDLWSWPENQFQQVSELAKPYVGHFHEYLVRGGFPQIAQIESITQAQRLLREDIIDKVLKRDMTALFGVRRVLELEQVFLYLCMHDGGILDIPNLCSNLGVKRPTTQNFIELLEATNLIYRLQPYGYGKEILRGKYKIYLADAAIAPAVLLKGKSVLDDPDALGTAVETTVFKHLLTRYYSETVRLTYWTSKKTNEIDIVVEIRNEIVPFEVKYRSQHTHAKELKGLIEFCKEKSIKRAYVITKSLDDFGPLNIPGLETQIMRVPATLFCYWIGQTENVEDRKA